MAPIPINSNSHSVLDADLAARHLNVLASCYVVGADSALRTLHYATTGLTGAECPPLAAVVTTSNEVALLPKPGGKRRLGRRGGAARHIREECERFFCGPLATAFRGETDPYHASGPDLVARASAALSDSDDSFNNNLTPPPDEIDHDPIHQIHHYRDTYDRDSIPNYFATGWMEIWDYVGGASFRAFMADNGVDKSLFVFFDAGVVASRDLKQALMAMIELAESPLACSNLVICIDRFIPAREAQALLRSLQWVGFQTTTLDHWSGDIDVVSHRWMFVGMEL